MIGVRIIRAIAWSLVVLSLGLFGCASQGGTGGDNNTQVKTTSLQVSGVPGTEFTVDYQVGGHSRSVTMSLTAKKPSVTIVELTGNDLECNVRKRKRSASVTVGIYRDGKGLFLTEVPTGTQGVRITRIWAGWKAEPY